MKTGVFRAGLSAKSLPTELYDDEPGESKTDGDRSSVGTVSCACEGFLFQRFETDRSFVDFVVETPFQCGSLQKGLTRIGREVFARNRKARGEQWPMRSLSWL
uniref:(northern house mosquito) hypothetical protein n=1 Tax=Culex pipiens TaxID=7175 RepID=A0A8D8CNL6_CULPI